MLDKPTIVFMPHCDERLYEALLRTNWTPAYLGNLLLIGNRLAEYAVKCEFILLYARPVLSR